MLTVIKELSVIGGVTSSVSVLDVTDGFVWGSSGGGFGLVCDLVSEDVVTVVVVVSDSVFTFDDAFEHPIIQINANSIAGIKSFFIDISFEKLCNCTL